VGQRLLVFFISINVHPKDVIEFIFGSDSGFSNLNLSACSLLQVLECYIISVEFFIIALLSALWIMLPAYLPNPVAAL